MFAAYAADSEVVQFGHTPARNMVQEVEKPIPSKWDASKGVNVKWHHPDASVAEGIATRGDRRVGAAIERVWREGGLFQEWGEHFDLALWNAACEAEGVPAAPINRIGTAIGRSALNATEIPTPGPSARMRFTESSTG